ncbi:unnamed protein product, partial [Mesorhabditis spiculigera]
MKKSALSTRAFYRSVDRLAPCVATLHTDGDPQRMGETHRRFHGRAPRIVDGELDKFSDDQLQPFLPLLVSSKFGPNSSSVAPELFARLTTFSRESFILDCLKVDYTEVAKRINDFSNYNTTSKSPADKYVYYVSKLLRTEIVDSNLHQWVGDSELPMATLLLSLAILHMPSVVKTSLVVTRLLSIQNGPQILAEIACNKVTPEDTPKGKNREQMLMNLLSLCPVLITDRVLAKLTEHKRDAASAARLCALIGSDTQFVRFMSSHPDRQHLARPHRHQKKRPKTASCRADPTANFCNPEEAGGKVGFLYLKIYKNHEPNPEFIMALAQLKILLPRQAESRGSRAAAAMEDDFLQIPVHSHTHAALCALLSITSLTSAQQSTPNASTPHNEQRWMVDYLQWLKAEAIASHKRQDSTFHSILVAALCVWTGRVDEINRFLGSSLSCKVAITSRHFKRFAPFSCPCCREKELVLLCVDLPVTIDLHDSHESSEPLPILWISDLLSQKVFQKYNVDVGSWIGRQISAAALPTSAVLIEVIER